MFDIIVTIITVIYVIICILMILIILLQAGRGGMGTALGGGASQSVFGGGGSSDVLAKITQGCSAGFMVFAMFLAYASAHSGSDRLKDKSDEANAEDMASADDSALNYEFIGPGAQSLPPRRDPADKSSAPLTSTPPVEPTPADPAMPTPADAPAAVPTEPPPAEPTDTKPTVPSDTKSDTRPATTETKVVAPKVVVPKVVVPKPPRPRPAKTETKTDAEPAPDLLPAEPAEAPAP